MPTPTSLTALRARYVFPVAGPPIENGFVVFDGANIVDVVATPPDCPATDLGDVAILPGLVNAHTHLEFSDLEAPLGTPGLPLPDWIRLVMAERRASTGDQTSAIQRGLRESLECGTTTLGEIASSDWRELGIGDPDNSLPAPRVAMFLELIAPLPERVPGAVAAAERLAASTASESLWPALSPHAPYTVHSELLDHVIEQSRRHRVPLAMHLAESPAELELLRDRDGAFVPLLRELNAWDPSPQSRFSRILEYLLRLAAAPRVLAIHGNYLDHEEMQFLATHRATMSVVYCPRTHAFFGHSAYPLARMLEQGVSLGLGTDSRASNPDLSVLAEMKFVAGMHSDVPLATVLELGTWGGARALGLDSRLGTLDAGKLADMTIVQITERTGRDPHELLFAPESRVVQTWIGGQCVYIDGPN